MTENARSGYDVRVARPADAAEIARLLSLLGHPTSEADVADRWGAWEAEGDSALVAERADGTLAGTITLHRMRVLHRPRPVGRITALVVDARERGSGIGRALVDAAEATLAAAGCGLVELTSHARWTGGHAFYEHIGFERTSFRFAKDFPPDE